MTNIRLGFRMLFRTPVVTAVAVLSLAFAIGPNAAIFSVFSQVLLRPLPGRGARAASSTWRPRDPKRGGPVATAPAAATRSSAIRCSVTWSAGKRSLLILPPTGRSPSTSPIEDAR